MAEENKNEKETEPRRPSACADADLAGQYAVYSGTGILRLSDLRAEQLAASKQGNHAGHRLFVDFVVCSQESD